MLRELVDEAIVVDAGLNKARRLKCHRVVFVFRDAVRADPPVSFGDLESFGQRIINDCSPVLRRSISEFDNTESCRISETYQPLRDIEVRLPCGEVTLMGLIVTRLISNCRAVSAYSDEAGTRN